MPARVLYVGQEVKIVTNGSLTKYFPVQSASCELTRPLDDVLSFGRLTSLGRFQNSVATCKSDIKTYISNNTGAAASQLLNSAFIQGLTGEALAGSVSVITVSPNGFIMSGILASFGLEISQGNFATADMSFVGVGEPAYAAAPGSNVYAEQSNMPSSFTPVTSASISGPAATGCASSFKFNLDLPNDTLSCLGGTVSGSQAVVASSFLQVAKPPFKATISVEGTAIDPPSGALLSTQYQIGKLGITLPAAQITSRSFNNAVGNVGATYNFVIEDVTASFSDLS